MKCDLPIFDPHLAEEALSVTLHRRGGATVRVDGWHRIYCGVSGTSYDIHAGEHKLHPGDIVECANQRYSVTI